MLLFIGDEEYLTSVENRSVPFCHTKFYLISIYQYINPNSEIGAKASKLTGISEKTSLVRLGLEALIARESARRLAELGGTEKLLRPVPRRRFAGN